MTTHTVAPDVFEGLATGGGDVQGVLRAGQRSKRLLLLYELMTVTRARAPQVYADAHAAETFVVLSELQRHDRLAVDEVLLQPHIGAWATWCLRRLLRDGSAEPGDIGHLGAITASAALRAGRAFDVTTYVRDGTVMLPTFGTVRLGTTDGWCRIRSSSHGDGVEISMAGASTPVPFRSSARWVPLHRLRSSVGGVTLDVQLDDLDPYRGCGHLGPADRLGEAAVGDWQDKLDAAWALLVSDHRSQAEAIGAGVVSVVPLEPSPVAAELSASCHEAIGAVAMTPPRNPLSLALALVHEFQHTKLSALLDLVPLLDRSRETLSYAPWRSDPRPLRGLLQGTYAFLGLTGFWAVHRHRDGPDDSGGRAADAAWAQFELALGRNQVGQALHTLRSSGRLREPGVRFVDGMRRRLAQLDRLSVPRGVVSLARLAWLDHATSWRLRNVRPDPEEIARWAEAWLAGRECPPHRRAPASLVDGGGPMPSNARLALLRQRVGFPREWQSKVGDASPADVLLVEGEAEQAAMGYRAQLAHAPDDLASWSGLALCAADRTADRTAAASSMRTCPERVYALHQAVRSTGAEPAVDDLASWVAQGAS